MRFKMLRRVFLASALALSGLTFQAVAQEITPFPDTSRLVVIGGSLTEIVYALGEEGKLVARDTTATYPEAATKLPDVGYMRALAAEGVLSVNPTALLVVSGSGPKETLDVLSKAGVPYIQVQDSYSSEGILEKVRLVGEALGANDKAAALSASLRTELDDIAAIKAKVSAPKRVIFVLSVQDGQLMASGIGTAANGAITLAGAVNAAGDYQGYKILNDEAIIAARPDVILMMDNAGDGSATEDALLAHPAVQQTPAGQNKAVIHMDGSYLLGFGPRTPAAIKELLGQLYPDIAG